MEYLVVNNRNVVVYSGSYEDCVAYAKIVRKCDGKVSIYQMTTH